ncbi:MAG: DUF1365 domain-containing protein [Rhodothalassiaceae bacterium]
MLRPDQISRRDDERDGPPPCALYVGEVMHRRLGRVVKRFRYRVFALLLDPDRLEDRARTLRVFSIDRPNLFSFYRRDHGTREDEPTSDWARRIFSEVGIVPAHLRLLCFPRIFGYVFNPLSVLYGYDAQGRLVGVIHEVHNTFGERHAYVFENHAGNDMTDLRFEVGKAFHVSPFLPLEGRYRFRMTPPGADLVIAIAYHGPGDRLIAIQTGRREDLSDANLLKRLVTHPLMTLKIILAIHWEALGLWRRGAAFHRKPPPPERGHDVGFAPGAMDKEGARK